MAYCPKCRYEYYKGVDVCYDCGTELVDTLPDEIDPRDIKCKWKALNILPGRIYADMAKEVFDKKGNFRGILSSGADALLRLTTPLGLALDSNRRLYVVQSTLNKVSVYVFHDK